MRLPCLVAARHLSLCIKRRRPPPSSSFLIRKRSSALAMMTSSLAQRRSFTSKEGAHHEPHENGNHHHEHDHGTDAEKVIEALKGGGDRGSRITLIGLVANVGLTGAKGLAGWYLHSASLLADAGHSLSDLCGDFVTLFCWQLSRQPRSNKYPLGFGKFETLGTTTVSLLLVGGALGIGFHSFYLLLPAIQAMPSGLFQTALQGVADATGAVMAHVPAAGGHAHAHVDVDPNAAWFAAASVVAKEYLYRVTKKVADEEHSSVLRANALHHRSDAWSSLVALVAILGTWANPRLPLDPLGGLVVSFVILAQGLGLLRGAFRQLMDAGVSEKTRLSLARCLGPLYDDASALHLPSLVAVRDVRAVRAGALMFVDLVAVVRADTSVADAWRVQQAITRRLTAFKKEIVEVRISLRPDEEK